MIDSVAVCTESTHPKQGTHCPVCAYERNRTPAKPFDEATARVTTAIYGGVDEWDVRLTLFVAKDQITEERLRELMPEVLKGGICIGVEVRRASRVPS